MSPCCWNAFWVIYGALCVLNFLEKRVITVIIVDLAVKFIFKLYLHYCVYSVMGYEVMLWRKGKKNPFWTSINGRFNGLVNSDCPAYCVDWFFVEFLLDPGLSPSAVPSTSFLSESVPPSPRETSPSSFQPFHNHHLGLSYRTFVVKKSGRTSECTHFIFLSLFYLFFSLSSCSIYLNFELEHFVRSHRGYLTCFWLLVNLLYQLIAYNNWSYFPYFVIYFHMLKVKIIECEVLI